MTVALAMMRNYRHDCSACVFLGSHRVTTPRPMLVDLYWCPNEGRHGTPVSRRSSDGPEYISGAIHADVFEELAEAMRRAILRGLV